MLDDLACLFTSQLAVDWAFDVFRKLVAMAIEKLARHTRYSRMWQAVIATVVGVTSVTWNSPYLPDFVVTA